MKKILLTIIVGLLCTFMPAFAQQQDSYVTLTTSMKVNSEVKLKILGEGEISFSGLEFVKEEDLYGETVYTYRVLNNDVKILGKVTQLVIDYFDVTALDVSHCPSLEVLRCKANALETLDVTQNPVLGLLDCSSCRLKSLDVQNNTKLTYLDCSENSLSGIDLKNNTLIETLQLSQNTLNSIDLSALENLTFCILDSDSLKQLNISHNKKLQKLYANDNQLTALDISMNAELKELQLAMNNFMAFDVQSSSLTDLYINDNHLKTLTLDATNLQLLCCYANSLEVLDLSKVKRLNTLSAHHNSLNSIKVDDLPNLEYLWINNNKLTALTVSNSQPLYTIECHENSLGKDACAELMNSLPMREPDLACVLIIVNSPATADNQCTRSAVEMARTKHWGVYDFVQGEEGYPGVPYEGLEETTCNTVHAEHCAVSVQGGKLVFVGTKPCNVALYGMHGQLVCRAQYVQEIDMSAYPKGCYVVTYDGKAKKVVY